MRAGDKENVELLMLDNVLYAQRLEMTLDSKREYSSQADYSGWVREDAQRRVSNVMSFLRQAFENSIHKEELEIIVFSDVTARQLANKIGRYPLILKPLLLASNIAARAIERD